MKDLKRFVFSIKPIMQKKKKIAHHVRLFLFASFISEVHSSQRRQLEIIKFFIIHCILLVFTTTTCILIPISIICLFPLISTILKSS